MLTWFGLGNHFLKSLVRRQGGGSGWKGKCITDGRMRYNQLQEKEEEYRLLWEDTGTGGGGATAGVTLWE